jgi:5-methylthioadenosine/S-adenosylhomocysteine deaminase
MWPFETKQDKKAVAAGRSLALVEMIKSGTTTFLEMYHLFMDDFASFIEKVGIRSSLMRSMIGLCPVEEQEAKLREATSFAKTWHRQANGRIQTMLAPHAPYTCPPPFIERIVEEAVALELPVHMHLAETEKEIADHIKQYGVHPLTQLEESHLLEPVSWLFAHGVHLTEEHLDMLQKYDASISHNPISNLKLGSGIAPVEKILEKNVTVSLGTDSSASNNTLDLFEEMRMAALLHKGVNRNPTLISAEQSLQLATINGAKALQMENLGRIQKGFEADFLLLDSSGSHLQPAKHVCSHVVYAAKSPDVTDVFVQGKALMENRQLLTLDEEKIVAEANSEYKRICEQL